MKHLTTVVVPEHTKQVVDYTTCDICKKRIEEKGSYVVEEVTVLAKTGEAYPEGGSGEKIDFDICMDCFKSKLLPWLAEQGAPVQWKEWDW